MDGNINVRVSFNGSLLSFPFSASSCSYKSLTLEIKNTHNIDEPIITSCLSKKGEFIQFDTDDELRTILNSFVEHKDGRSPLLRVFVKTLRQLENSDPPQAPQNADGFDDSGSSATQTNSSAIDSFRSQISFSSQQLPYPNMSHPGSLNVSSLRSIQEFGGSTASSNSINSQVLYNSVSSTFSHAESTLRTSSENETANNELLAKINGLKAQFKLAFPDNKEVLDQINLVFDQVGQNKVDLGYALSEIQKVLKVVPTKYGAELQTLKEMGFTDEQTSTKLLEEHGGEIEKVVEVLTK
ncbi:hypothetical protein HK098_001106 [Nowakowskiella sp. JEL0407]|nr:hypothetical protein HK098_001106 [Nowakowskiella sp. JEL0407]